MYDQFFDAVEKIVNEPPQPGDTSWREKARRLENAALESGAHNLLMELTAFLVHCGYGDKYFGPISKQEE